MKATNKRGVPGVPLNALDAITDENARLVLRSIVDGWHVRNGSAGDGEAAFITRSELKDLTKTEIKNYLTTGSPTTTGTAVDGSLPPGKIDQIINEIQAAVFESQLWKDLGTNIAAIDLAVAAEQQARIAAVQDVSNALADEAATRLGFDTAAGSKIAVLESSSTEQATRITGLTTRTTNAESAIVALQDTTAAQATNLTRLNTRMGDAESSITSLFTTTSSQSQSLTSLTTRITGAESSIASLNTTTADQASTLSSLSTRVAGAESGIVNEALTRTNADNAISTSVATQFTKVNDSLSAIQTAQQTLSNSVSSLSTTTTNLQSSVSTLSSSLSTEATTRADADGKLSAQYTVKVDLNGYVAGYGLASTAVNGKPKADFIVRADRFSIGSPSGPGITPVAPFTVLTTPDASGNQAGVYITETMIKRASISSAYIQDAAVDTLKIAGNAIFVSRTYSFADVYCDTVNSYLNQLLVFDFIQDVAPIGGGFTANMLCYFDNSNTADSFGIVRLLMDGMEVSRQKFGVRSTSGNSKSIMPVILSASGISNGQNRLQMYVHLSSWRNDTDADYGTFHLKNIKVVISASKR